MTIALKCIAAVFVGSLTEPLLRVIFLGGIVRKWVSAIYQQINISLLVSWENFKILKFQNFCFMTKRNILNK